MSDMEMYQRISEKTHVGDEPVEDAPALDEMIGVEAPVAAPVKPAPEKAPSVPAAARREPRIHKYLKYVVELKASDLHFRRIFPAPTSAMEGCPPSNIFLQMKRARKDITNSLPMDTGGLEVCSTGMPAKDA